MASVFVTEIHKYGVLKTNTIFIEEWKNGRDSLYLSRVNLFGRSDRMGEALMKNWDNVLAGYNKTWYANFTTLKEMFDFLYIQQRFPILKISQIISTDHSLVSHKLKELGYNVRPKGWDLKKTKAYEIAAFLIDHDLVQKEVDYKELGKLLGTSPNYACQVKRIVMNVAEAYEERKSI